MTTVTTATTATFDVDSIATIAPSTVSTADLGAIIEQAGHCVADLGPDDLRRPRAARILSELVTVVRSAIDGQVSVATGGNVPWVVCLRELSVVGHRLIGRRDAPVTADVVDTARMRLAALRGAVG